MNAYTYKNPTERGYEEIKLTKEEHHKIFKRHKKKFIIYKYFKKGSKYKCQYYTNKLGVILELIINIPKILWNEGIKVLISEIACINERLDPLLHSQFCEIYGNVEE